MEQTLAPGSQTFEQDLFRLYREGIVSLDEALANADSPTNLSWLINNSDQSAELANGVEPAPGGKGEGASFSEFKLEVKGAG